MSKTPNPTQTTPIVTAAELNRHDIVEWDWADAGAIGLQAVSRGIRPLGRVVSRDDCPNMLIREGPLNVQLVDVPMWLFSPKMVLEKGHRIWKVSGT